MAWPDGDSVLPVKVEIYTGSWVDITSSVMVREGGVMIVRGFPDEGSIPEPGSTTILLKNTSGDFSPRNPTGTYYGKIGRNTPVRVTIGNELAGQKYLEIGKEAAHRSFAFDDASLDITGDIDIRWDGAWDLWPSAALASKYATASDNRSWAFIVNSDGFLSFAWSTDGTSGTLSSATSTVRPDLLTGQRIALRVTLDVDNGSSGWTATFYTADTIDDSWTQLGDAVTDSGTTSIYASTVVLSVGHNTDFPTNPTSGRLYAFQLRDGIAGTLVADADYTSQATGAAAAFTDSVGQSWSLNGTLYIRDPGMRTIQEISEWPARWDVSESDVTVPVVAQGVLRRLGQGARSVSPLTSAMLAIDGRRGYWPMEDADGSTTFAAEAQPIISSDTLTQPGPMTYTGDAPDFAASGAFLGSDSVAVLNATTVLTGAVPTYAPATTSNIILVCIMSVPSTPGWADDTPLVHIDQPTNGSTVATWQIRYKTGGSLQLRGLDSSGSELVASGTLAFGVDGTDFMLTLRVIEDGSDTDWVVRVRTIDDDGVTVSETASTGTFSSVLPTIASHVRVAPSGGLADLSVGQIAVGLGLFDVESSIWTGTGTALTSFSGETAAERADRLCEVASVSLAFVGSVTESETAAMGPQATPSTFLEALTETWQADLALLFETRYELGLTFLPRAALYNRPVKLELDYSLRGEIAPNLEPTDDDRFVRNDVTVTRKDGSSARAVDSTSRMGTQDPPDGVGRYEHSVTLNLFDDAVLVHFAGWLLHLGTWDEARYPTVRINLAALAAAGKWDLVAAAAQLDVGDRIRLTNLPSFLPPGPVDLLCMGFTELIGHPTQWEIVVNCVPYGPYMVFQVGDQVHGRLDTSGSALALDVTSAATSLLVATDTGRQRWITTSERPEDFPFTATLGGEVVTVTVISGTTSPQTFTVTRAVNGISKAHDAGTDVRIAGIAVPA